MLDHAGGGDKEVGYGGGEVEEAIGAEGAHELAHRAKDEEVVGDGREWEGQKKVLGLGGVVFAEHVDHFVLVLRIRDDSAVGGLREEVEEAIGGMGVVPRVGQQRELAVQEDDGVSCLEEEIGRAHV